MNRVTARDINELLNCVERMEKAADAFFAVEHSDESAKLTARMKYSEMIGAVIGQAKIVRAVLAKVKGA